jgi:hypothetical protein
LPRLIGSRDPGTFSHETLKIDDSSTTLLPNGEVAMS